MAPGASRRDILALLMRGGLVSTAAGIMAGALAALAMIQMARSAIPELQTPDLRVLPAVLLPLAVAAVAGAGFRASARHARIQPRRCARTETHLLHAFRSSVTYFGGRPLPHGHGCSEIPL
jgi:hypothetical protein